MAVYGSNFSSLTASVLRESVKVAMVGNLSLSLSLFSLSL